MRNGWRLRAAVGALGLAVLCWCALCAWVWSRIEPRPLVGLEPPAGTTLSAQSCQPCHTEIYDEWAASRMGQAMVEPVFAADFALQGEPFVCLHCHAPLAEQQPTTVWGLVSIRPLMPLAVRNPAFDPALQSEGVTCVACHLSEGAMVGGLDDPQAPHPTRRGEPRACGHCHQLAEPPLSNLDRPITDTVGEWERWKDETGGHADCVTCHMPAVERVVGAGGPVRMGHRHTWHGAWNAEMVRSALEVAAWRDGAEVVVRLTNRAGHNVPSGDPARALVVQAGDAEVVLARRVPLPRLIDQGDTTLQPGETRDIRLPYASRVRVVFERLRFLDVGIDEEGVVVFDQSI